MAKKENKSQPKFNSYWIYGIIISVLLLASMYTDGSSGSVKKTNISEFEKFLNEGDIKEVSVINKNLAMVTLNELALEENNSAVQSDIIQNIKQLNLEIKKSEIKCFLSSEADPLDCYIEIHAGAGGTESQDWADMLRRMYLKWSDKKNFKSNLISEHRGDEAGIKSITYKIEGENAYGLLKNESGVHRLVRISPFDAQKRRHTSFASVWVYPEVSNNIIIEIETKDIRVDTYRASGAGGQHVNKTDSAVRITHLPTKIVVQCQSDRSQHKNRSNAMKMIKSRIYETELKKRKEDENLKNKEKKDIYYCRFEGILNSILMRKSWYRPKIN